MSFRWLMHEGERVRVATVRTPAGLWVGWPGGACLVEKKDVHAAEDDSQDDGIRAPMTGKVIKIEVAVGDQVEAEQPVVILEAMKMEYRLTAPHGGTVEAIHCVEGEQVDLGATLVTLAE